MLGLKVDILKKNVVLWLREKFLHVSNSCVHRICLFLEHSEKTFVLYFCLSATLVENVNWTEGLTENDLSR